MCVSGAALAVSEGEQRLSLPPTIQLQGAGGAGGAQQIVALPAQGLLPSGAQAITIQTKPGVSPSQKVLTIVTTTASGASSPATLARVGGHPVTVVTTQVGDLCTLKHL